MMSMMMIDEYDDSDGDTCHSDDSDGDTYHDDNQ